MNKDELRSLLQQHWGKEEDVVNAIYSAIELDHSKLNNLAFAIETYWPNACDICLCNSIETCDFCAVGIALKALEKE